MSTPKVFVRQTNTSTTDPGDTIPNDGWWWFSPTAYAIKWGIIAAVFVLFLILFIGGHIHAKRRMKKGLQPLAYHRFLVTRRQRGRFQLPSQNPHSFYRPQDGYQMNNLRPPPPAYNPELDNVPAYSPPEDASKIKLAQNYAEIPPPGPPPTRSEGASSYAAYPLTPHHEEPGSDLRS